MNWSLSMLAIVGLFFIVGFGGGSWAARIVGLPEALNLDHQSLGFVLLMSVLGALVAFACSTRLLKKVSQAWLTSIAIGGYCAALALAGCTIDPYTTALALFLMGASSGFLTISMNLYAIAWEKREGRSMLASCHGYLSAGTLSGALVGQRADAMGLSIRTHLGGISGASALFAALLLVRQFYKLDAADKQSRDTNKSDDKDAGASGDAHADGKPDKKAKAPSQSLIVIGIMVACAAMSESTINGWGPLFLHQAFDLTTANAAYAFVIATSATVITRLLVERAVKRLGARKIVLFGCAFIALGAVMTLTAQTAHLALVSIALSSIGVASIVPLGYREASRRRPETTQKALAIMTQWTYSGALIAPPLVGFISEHFSMRIALASLGLLAIFVAWSSKALPGRAEA